MAVLLDHEVTGHADAPVLVLSGSVGSTIEMWEPNLAALSRTFRVVRLDHHGHGGSAVVPGPYRIAGLADDAMATLDALDVETFAWCGPSMGAMDGMAVAANRPQRVANPVLCCTSAHFAPTVWRERAEAVGRAPSLPESSAGGSRPGGRRSTRPRCIRRCPGQRDLRRGVPRPLLGDRGMGPPSAAAGDHRARPGDRRCARRGDSVDPDALTLADTIPDAQLEVLDAAHIATVEAPAEATELIRAHVARIPGKGAVRTSGPHPSSVDRISRDQPETSSNTLFLVSGPRTSTMTPPRRKNTAAMANAAPVP